MFQINLRPSFIHILISIIQLYCWVGHLALAQNPDGLGSWNVFNTKLNFNAKWSIFGEGQLRSLGFYNQFHYYEYKGGFNYKLNKNFSFSVGLGHYNTYQAGGSFVTPKQNDELRSWVQITMQQFLEIIKFEHRYRIEQRWQSKGYRNRFRYRFNVAVPLNSTELKTKTIYTMTWLEVFGTDIPPYFERLRFFTGLGYDVSPTVSLQAGWLRQFDYKLVDEVGHNFLQFSLLLDLKWKKESNRSLPTVID